MLAVISRFHGQHITLFSQPIRAYCSGFFFWVRAVSACLPLVHWFVLLVGFVGRSVDAARSPLTTCVCTCVRVRVCVYVQFAPALVVFNAYRLRFVKGGPSSIHFHPPEPRQHLPKPQLGQNSPLSLPSAALP